MGRGRGAGSGGCRETSGIGVRGIGRPSCSSGRVVEGFASVMSVPCDGGSLVVSMI